MSVQKKDWGNILWMENGSSGLFQNGMNVGIATLEVGAHQHQHVHYEEQVIYVIQGQALSIIDGEETSLTPGKFFHWKAGVIHEIFNIGNIPFQHFLISNPSQDEIKEPEKIIFEKRNPSRSIGNLLFLAVEAIKIQFLNNLHYAYEIYDWSGNQVMQSKEVPSFCYKHCNKNADIKCPCVMNQNKEKYKEETIFFCPHGLEIFHVPIFYDSCFLGYIQGGYIYQSNKTAKAADEIYDTPDSTAIGIFNLLRKIAKSIQNFCEFEELRQTMLEKDLEIQDSRTAQNQLIQNLRNAEYEMTDLKINNHFLFNTLNGMASMALENNQINLYQSIVDLSKMFHYTLRTQENLVPLGKELDYIKAYLQLQKLRYGEKLKTVYEIETGVEKYIVPFNFLQPIVENAFIHGFAENIGKEIIIRIEEISEKVHIEIKNTGKTLDSVEIELVNEKMKNGSSHGMSMIYHKLAAVYGEKFHFEFKKNDSIGMEFLVVIPKQFFEGGADDTCSYM